MDLSVIALALALATEDATDVASRKAMVEIVERPAPAPHLMKKHMSSPALVVVGSVLAAGSTGAIVAIAVAAASGDPTWQGIGPFTIIAAAGVLTGAVSMIIVGASQVPF